MPGSLSRMNSQSLESLELLSLSLLLSTSLTVFLPALVLVFFAVSAAVVERVTRGILGLSGMIGLLPSFFFRIDFRRGFSASGLLARQCLAAVS